MNLYDSTDERMTIREVMPFTGCRTWKALFGLISGAGFPQPTWSRDEVKKWYEGGNKGLITRRREELLRPRAILVELLVEILSDLRSRGRWAVIADDVVAHPKWKSPPFPDNQSRQFFGLMGDAGYTRVSGHYAPQRNGRPARWRVWDEDEHRWAVRVVYAPADASEVERETWAWERARRD